MPPTFSFANLHRQYLRCRKNKRNTLNALRFEYDLEENLVRLQEELEGQTYKPSRSVCFVPAMPLKAIGSPGAGVPAQPAPGARSGIPPVEHRGEARALARRVGTFYRPADSPCAAAVGGRISSGRVAGTKRAQEESQGELRARSVAVRCRDCRDLRRSDSHLRTRRAPGHDRERLHGRATQRSGGDPRAHGLARVAAQPVECPGTELWGKVDGRVGARKERSWRSGLQDWSCWAR